MNDTTLNPADQPSLPPMVEVETDNLRSIYVYLDTPGDTTRRPSRGPILEQLRPDQPLSPPPTDKDQRS